MFIVKRVKASVLRANPDSAAIPMGKATSSTVVGIVLVVVVGLGFLVAGVLHPGPDKSWQAQNAIVVSKDTGARYVYLNKVLHPVSNISSARLILGSDAVTSLSSVQLAGVTRGEPVGIPGAPDDVPANLTNSSPEFCVVSPSSGSGKPFIVVLDGETSPASSLGSTSFLAVTPDGHTYLIWHGQRFAMPSHSAAVALGISGVPVPVPTAWLDAVPPGSSLEPPEIPNRGAPVANVPGVDGARSGQVLQTTAVSGTNAFSVVLPSGVAPISETAAALMMSDPRSASSYPGLPVAPRKISLAAVSELSSRASASFTGVPTSWPESPPSTLGVSGRAAVPCLRMQSMSGGHPQMALSTADATQFTERMGISRTSHTTKTLMTPGTGTVVRGVDSHGKGVGSTYLLTDSGTAFPLVSKESTQRLGYGDPSVVAIPRKLLDSLPRGPALDANVAQKPLLAASVTNQ